MANAMWWVRAMDKKSGQPLFLSLSSGGPRRVSSLSELALGVSADGPQRPRQRPHHSRD
jgi:hypothetical protein